MSINMKYKFLIKSKEPSKVLNNLVNKKNMTINFDYLKKMPKEILNETTYGSWATKEFGHSYNWSICNAYCDGNLATLEIEGNKTCCNLKPWFDRFKKRLEVYIFSEFDRHECLITDYMHVTYNDDGILFLSHYDELGLEFQKKLKSKNKKKKELLIL